MTSKHTKRALLSSVLSLVLCFSMLLGATFAWFTDTATTSVNTIQAGTLDVALLDVPNGNSLEGQTLSWQRAGDATGAILWEPGCTYNLQPITIQNKGNLALKYKVVLAGIQGDAELNEAIEWTITNTTSEVSAHDAESAPSVLETEYQLLPGAYHTLTISGHMQESAGNEYQGKSIDGIAIAVLATQDTVEYDSTDNQYDANAQYPDYEVVSIGNTLPTEKIEDSHIILSENITGTGTISGIYDSGSYPITTGFIMNGGILDGGGKTLSLTGTSYGIQTNGGTIKNVTIKGTGRAIMLHSLQEDVYIDNVVVDENVYGINTAEHNGHRLIVTNSTINGWTSFAGLDSASFTDCNFGKSNGYAYLRPYSETTISNCEFTDASFKLNAGGTGAYTITLTNCTKNGTAITADNVVSLLVDTDYWNTNATLIVNGTTVSVTRTTPAT